jgi:hypothetical protein
VTSVYQSGGAYSQAGKLDALPFSSMDRFTWAIVVGVVALVVAGLAVAGTLRGRDTPPDLSTPSGVVLAYALAEQRGDGQVAWDLLAMSVQARADHDRFLARFGSRGTDRAYLSVEDEQGSGDTRSVVLVRTFPGSGSLFGGSSYANRTTVRLAREPAGWRITVPPDDYLLNERF